jgi:hypothetical protein
MDPMRNYPIKRYRLHHALKRFHDFFGLRTFIIFALSCIVPMHLPVTLKAESVLEIGKFSAEKEGSQIPPGWKLQTFKAIPKTTTFSLVHEAGTVVLRAESRSSYAALVKNVHIDPREFPIIKWRWKTNGIYTKGDISRKDGDDYSARLYILFEYQPEKLSTWERLQYQAARLFFGEYPPTSAINYIWGNRSPLGSVVPNAYTKRTMMFVLQSGGHRLNTWIEENRNVYEDYLEAFRSEPPFITAIAIANDSDNTGESSISYFGDIELRKE